MTRLPYASRFARRASVLWLAAVIVVPTAVAVVHEIVPLPVCEARGLDHAASGWQIRRSLYLEGTDGFCMEAEAASSLLGKPPIPGVTKDEKARGQCCLVNPPALAFELNAATGGSYVLQLRIRKHAPSWRGYNSRVNKDLGEKRSPEIAAVTVDRKALPRLSVEPFDKLTVAWSWQKLCTIQLTKGTHVLGLGELPGYGVDALALCKTTGNVASSGEVGVGDLMRDEDDDFALAELEGAMGASPLDSMQAGERRLVELAEVETALIRPLAVARWGRLSVAGELHGRPPRMSASSDGGTTWLDLALDGDLSVIPVKGDGTDSLRARLSWWPTHPQETPTLSGLSVSFTSAPSDPVTVVGPGARFTFDRAGGALIDIRRPEDGAWLALPLHRSLFRLGWVAAGQSEVRTLTSGDFTRVAAEDKPSDTASSSFGFVHAETGLEVDVLIRPSAEARHPSLWTLSVRNAGTGTIRWTAFPEFGGLLCGGKYLLPESLWGVAGSGVFPGNLSMGFVFAHDGETGLTLAGHDRSFVAVQLTAASRGGVSVVSATSQAFVPPGASRSLEYAVAVGAPDWHWAADQYRDWALSWMKRPVWPDWARRADGWFSLRADTEAGLLDRRSTTIFEDARWLGLNHLQLWTGSGDGEFCGRMPYLSPRLGTPEMSRRDSERIRRLGGHIGHYVQAREWRADFATADRIGFISRRHFPEGFTVEDEAWSRRNTLSGGEVQIMCPASDEWQAHIARHAGERVSLFGNDTAYFDQMGCTVMSCSRTNHGHGQEYGVSGAGYMRMAERAVAAMQAELPEVAISQEGMNAASGQYVHFHLASSRPAREHGREFLYTFPDAAIFRGYGNGVYQWQGSPPASFARDLYVFHRFEVPVYLPCFRDVILLRRRIHDWQYDGRYMDDVGLTLTIPADAPVDHRTRARWFLYDRDGTQGVLINYRNEQRLENVGLELDRDHLPFTPPDKAFAYFDDGEVAVVACRADGTALALDLPARRVGTILIPGPVTASQALRAYASQSYAPGPDRLALRAVNISAKPLEATWTLRVPDELGLNFEPTSGTVRLAPSSVWGGDVAVRGLTGGRVMADVVVDWEHGGEQSTCRALVTPPLRNGDLDLDLNEDGSPDSWWNFSNAYFHQIHRFSDSVDMRSLPAVCDTAVKRSGRASARVKAPMTYTLTVDSDFGRPGTERPWASSIAQHLYLKSGTHYRVTAYALATSTKARCEMRCGTQSFRPQRLTPGEWTALTVEVTVGPHQEPAILTLENKSSDDAPVWFDDVTLVELDAGPSDGTE